jgi:hypothetical protein
VQGDVVDKQASCRDVCDEVLLQLLVLGEEVGCEGLCPSVDVVYAFFNLFDLFPNIVRSKQKELGTEISSE